MNIPEHILSTLTDEQKEKAMAAKTPEELLSIAEETGYQLDKDQLESISGGWCAWHCATETCKRFFRETQEEEK